MELERRALMGIQTNVVSAAATFIVSSTAPPKQSLEKEKSLKDTQQNLPETPSDPEAEQMFSAALNKLNTQLQKSSSELRFTQDKETGKTVFKVMGKNGTVLMQIPSEELLALSRKLKAQAQEDAPITGVLLDKKG